MPNSSSTSPSKAWIITGPTSGFGQTGTYYDENGKPMTASAQVRDPAFVARVATETRALLATVPTDSLIQSLLARKEP